MATTTEDCLKSYERRIYIHVYVYVYTQRGQSGEMGAGELAGHRWAPSVDFMNYEYHSNYL